MKKATKPVKPAPLPRTLERRIKKLHPLFFVSLPTKLTVTIPFDSYLHAFMYMCRIVVHTEVLGLTPQITLTEQQLKITIGKTGKNLTENDVVLAERITENLSTSHPIKAS